MIHGLANLLEEVGSIERSVTSGFEEEAV
jgi:hypothetical protein